MQYVGDLYTESCKVAAVNDDSPLNDTLIKLVDHSIFLCLREYWTMRSNADLTDIYSAVAVSDSKMFFKSCTIQQLYRTIKTFRSTQLE